MVTVWALSSPCAGTGFDERSPGHIGAGGAPASHQTFLSTSLLQEEAWASALSTLTDLDFLLSPSTFVVLRKGGRKPLVTSGISHRHMSSVSNRITVHTLLWILSSQAGWEGGFISVHPRSTQQAGELERRASRSPHPAPPAPAGRPEAPSDWSGR